jgi:hypothetical protein
MHQRMADAHSGDDGARHQERVARLRQKEGRSHTECHERRAEQAERPPADPVGECAEAWLGDNDPP